MNISESFESPSDALDEPIDVEFVATALGDVSVPADTPEGDGSVRCQLSDELVRTQYPATALATVPQALPLNQRIVASVPGAPGQSPYDLGAYGDCVAVLETQFPVRIARIRELYATCRLAEERQRKLWELRELERQALNRRNQETNRQLDGDIDALREEYRTDRNKLLTFLTEAEQAQVAYHLERQKAIREARDAYFKARRVDAERLDNLNAELEAAEREAASIKRTAEQEASEKRQAADLEFRRSVIKKHEEALEGGDEQRVRAWERAVASEKAAADAEDAAYRAELEAIERHTEATQEAQARYEELLTEVQQEIDEQWEAVQSRAAKAQSALLEERSVLESELHQVIQACTEESDRRATAVIDARSRAASSSARAGLARSNGDFAQEDGKRRWIATTIAAVTTFLTRFALGAVFGVSLALLAGFADLTPEGIQRLWLPLVVSAGLGFFIYQVIGKVAHRAAHDAALAVADNSSTLRKVGAYGGVALLLLILIALEATVERKGIVQAAMDQMLASRGEEQQLSLLDEIAYWAVALVFAAPYALLEAFHGKAEAHAKLATKQREDVRNKREREIALDPAVQAVAEHQALSKIAEDSHIAAPVQTAPRRQEAERRIAEIDRQLAQHPAIQLHTDFSPHREEHLRHQIMLSHAKEAWEAAAVAHQTDPTYVAARERAQSLRSVADADRALAEKLDAGVSTAAAQAVERIFSATGVGVAQAMSDIPAALLEGAQSGTFGSGLSAHLTAPAAVALDVAGSALRGAAGSAPTDATHSLAVTVAREDYISLSRSLGSDAQLKYYKGLIESYRKAIQTLDQQYQKRLRQLEGQKRAIELRMVAPEESNRGNPALDFAIAEEELNARAARLAFDEELLRLRELAESPRFIRSFVAWRQRVAARRTFNRNLLAIQQAPGLTPSLQPGRTT